jgi:hypothetical protein
MGSGDAEDRTAQATMTIAKTANRDGLEFMEFLPFASRFIVHHRRTDGV